MAAGGANPEVVFDPALPTKFEIFYLGLVHSISADDFGPNASFSAPAVAGEVKEEWKANVKAAPLPGTKLSLHGEIKLTRIEGVWLICFRFKQLFLQEDVVLSDWLSAAVNPEQLEFHPRRKLSREQSASVSNRFPDASITIQPNAMVSFRPIELSGAVSDDRHNEFVFQGDTAVHTGPNGLRVGAEKFSLAWSDQAVINGVANPPETRVNLYGLSCHVTEAIGKTRVDGKDVKVWFADCRVNSANVRLFKDTKGKNVADAEFGIDGRLRFDHLLEHAWPELPVEGIAHWSWKGPSNRKLRLVGTAPKNSGLTRGGAVSISIVSDREARDILIVEAGKVTVLDWRARLLSAFVPMQNADFSRFNFRDTSIAVVIEGLGEDIRTTDFIWSLGAEPQFSGGLSRKATLYFHRVADLADMTVRFRNLILIVRPKGAEIDCLEEPVPGGSLQDDDAPILIFELPPQQIAERTYLMGAKGNDGLTLRETKRAIPLAEQRAYQLPNDFVDPKNERSEFRNVISDAASGAMPNLDGNIHHSRNERVDPNVLDKLGDTSVAVQMLDRLVEARASGPTRIVLDVTKDTTDNEQSRLPMPFSTDALLDWSGFKTRVSRRALPKDASVEEQLKISGIQKNTPTERKIEFIGNEFDGRDQGRIGALETKIEYPYDLHLSPSSDARWLTSPAPTMARRNRGMGVFWTRLDSTQGADSVRALWSRSFEQNMDMLFGIDDPGGRGLPQHSTKDPASLIPNIEAATKGPSNRLPWLRDLMCKSTGKGEGFRLPMDIRDRFELVMLTSIYGLPSLLPEPNLIKPRDSVTTTPIPPSPPVEKASADPFIQPVPEGWESLTDGTLGKEGVYVPRPFSAFEFRLSSLGATGFFTGEWEPPSGFFNLEGGATAPEYPGLTIERAHSRSFQGRIIEAEVIYKGFLFPFGHRCSIVKATDRSFTDEVNDPGLSVAPLVQRFFIVVGNPEKTIPALGMPFDGRACPGVSVRMLTTRSKAIKDPWASDATKIGGLTQAVKGGSAFHPYGLGETSPLQFSFVIGYEDGSVSDEITAPLIVVDNTFAHDPVAIKSLIETYNSDSADKNIFAQAVLGMQRVKYAPEKASGDTEFRTESWRLGAHPRQVTDDLLALSGLAPFTMDAVMEGADQPPFYPCVAKAKIEVQSINSLNGKSGGLVEVSHDAHFLTHGFTPGVNDAEIFLSLIQRNFIETSHRKNASGGIATPNSKIVAISRLKGPVGGSADRLSDTTNTLPGAPEFAAFRTGGQAGGIENLPASHQNKFDPLEYFGNALSSAKLFGAIPLKDVVRAISFIDGAPELVETITRALFDFTEEGKDAAFVVIDTVVELLDAVRAEAEAALSQLDLEVDDLYPDLFRGMAELRSNLVALRGAIESFGPNATDTTGIVTSTANVAAGLQALEGHVRHVIANPTPAIVDQFITNAQTAFEQFKLLGRNLINDVEAKLTTEIEALFTVEVCAEQGETGPNDEINVNITWSQRQKDQFVLLAPILGLLPQDIYESIRLNRPVELNGVLPEYCQTFSLANPDGVARAGRNFDTLRRQAQEALLYETVGKPLIDGYVALEAFRQKYTDKALTLEQAIKSFPQELLTVTEAWLDGVLQLNQMSALINDQIKSVAGKLSDSVWKDVVLPALCHVILPLIDPLLRNGDALGIRSAKADTKISELVGKIRKLIQNAPTPELRGQLQQVASGLAQAQKRLRGATADLNATISAIAWPPNGKMPEGVYYFDLRHSYKDNKNPKDLEDPRDAYLAPLKKRFNEFASIGPAQAMMEINSQIGRLIVRKEQAFRAAKDVVQQAADSVQLADILATGDAARVELREQQLNELNRARTERDPKKVLALEAQAKRAVLEDDVKEIRQGATALLNEIQALIAAAFSSDLLRPDGTIDPMVRTRLSDHLNDAKVRFKDTSDRVDMIADNYRNRTEALDEAFIDLNAATTQNYRDKVNALTAELDGVIGYIFGEERLVVGLAGQAFAFLDDGKKRLRKLEDQANAEVVEQLVPVVKEALRLLVEFCESAKMAREALVPDMEYAPLLKLFLSPQVYDALFMIPLTTLDNDIRTLKEIQADLESSTFPDTLDEIQRLSELIRGWVKGTSVPGVITAFAPLAAVFETVTKGRLGDLVDFRALERAVREALFAFIPNEFYVDLGWATTIDPFPSEAGKFFWIERSLRNANPKIGDLTKEFLERRKKEGLQPESPDLVLASRSGVRLNSDFEPKPFFQVESYIFDPSVKLFGENFHVVTIQFDYIRFTADEKGTDLHVEVRPDLFGPKAGIIFGPVVEYIAALAEAFGGLLPPWLKLRPELPGVSAEFGFPAFSVSIGTMSILNLSVNIEIEVPFSNLPITSRFRLGHRDQPFMISFAPYGGGGYVGLITRATDIVGFELQLEFGAVVGLAFPPFNGYGAITAGIYIEHQKDRDLIIAGFVRAIGEGTLGIFSLAIHIEVRVTGQGSNVTGTAKFSFTFKVKIVSVTVGFTASYAFAGGNDGGPGKSRELLSDSERSKHTIIVDVPEAQVSGEWRAYRNLFID